MKPTFGARLVRSYSRCGLWAAVNRGNEMGSGYGINRRSCAPRVQFETRTISPGDRVGAGLALPYTHTSSSGRIGQDIGLAPTGSATPWLQESELANPHIAALAG